MKRWIVAVVALGMLSGCVQQGKTAQEEALKRWSVARSDVLRGLTSEYLKVGQLDSAAKAAKEALTLSPDCADARVLLAKVNIEQGQYEDAARELKVVREARPSDPGVHYLLGVAREKNQELELALASYREALSCAPTYTDAIVAIGEVLAEMQQPADALAYVEENLPSSPNHPGMYELAGRLAMMVTDYDKAERYYQSAHNLDYQNSCYLEALAQAQFSAGHYDRAAASLQELIAAPQYADRAGVHRMLGECLLVLGRPQEAYGAWCRATELDPGVPGSWQGLARAALSQGDFYRAISAAREAVALAPQDIETAMVLGYALLRNGQADQALTVLGAVSAAHPKDATLKCLLGRAYAAEGRNDKARRCYVDAVQAEPDNVVALELLAQSPPLKSAAELE